MKEKIHPKYVEATVTCGCGESFKTRSTREKIMVEVCSKCHPFYTGKQKFVDSAGMVERFTRKWQGNAAQAKAETMEKQKAKKAMAVKKVQKEEKPMEKMVAPPPAPKPHYAGNPTQTPPAVNP